MSEDNSYAVQYIPAILIGVTVELHISVESIIRLEQSDGDKESWIFQTCSSVDIRQL
jgi:hypothetical protein